VLDKLVYTLTNPVKDGLVRDYRKWPGFNTRPSDWRAVTRTVERPGYYFKKTPEQITYPISAPSQLGRAEHALDTVELHIRRAQEQAAVELAAQHQSVMGPRAVLASDPFDVPTTSRPSGKLNPVLAGGGDRKALVSPLSTTSALDPATHARLASLPAGATREARPSGAA
jgi:hypothetical protein